MNLEVLQRLWCCCHSHRRQWGVDRRRWRTSVPRPGQRGPSVCRVSPASIPPNNTFPELWCFCLSSRACILLWCRAHIRTHSLPDIGEKSKLSPEEWRPVTCCVCPPIPSRCCLHNEPVIADTCRYRRVVSVQHVICSSEFICSFSFNAAYAFAENLDRDSAIALLHSCQDDYFPDAWERKPAHKNLTEKAETLYCTAESWICVFNNSYPGFFLLLLCLVFLLIKL